MEQVDYRCPNAACAKAFKTENGLGWHLAHSPACDAYARAHARAREGGGSPSASARALPDLAPSPTAFKNAAEAGQTATPEDGEVDERGDRGVVDSEGEGETTQEAVADEAPPTSPLHAALLERDMLQDERDALAARAHDLEGALSKQSEEVARGRAVLEAHAVEADNLRVALREARARVGELERTVDRWVAWNSRRKAKEAKAMIAGPFYACPSARPPCDRPAVRTAPGSCTICGAPLVELRGARGPSEAEAVANHVHGWLDAVLERLSIEAAALEETDIEPLWTALGALRPPEPGQPGGDVVWDLVTELDQVARKPSTMQFPARTSALVRSLREQLFRIAVEAVYKPSGDDQPAGDAAEEE